MHITMGMEYVGHLDVWLVGYMEALYMLFA